jgi:hypothetical protein
MEEQVFLFLDKLGISYEVFPHAPITTMEEGKAIIDKLGFMPCKNLFLMNKQGQYFLLVMQGDKRFSAKGCSQADWRWPSVVCIIGRDESYASCRTRCCKHPGAHLRC